MRFVLFVEGPTEKKGLPQFLKRWLDPRLPARVGITPVKFEGWHDYYNGIGKKVSLTLSEKSGVDVIAGIGLLDLYGPTFFPEDKKSSTDRYRWAKREIEKRVDHPRFRQHFAVHELEAWLLSDPTILPNEVRDKLPGTADRPETVNFDEPPAKLLDQLYRKHVRRRYKKPIDGPNLFNLLDPETAIGKCPYLRHMLEDMLALAKQHP